MTLYVGEIRAQRISVDSAESRAMCRMWCAQLPQGGRFSLVFDKRGVTPRALISPISPTQSKADPHCRKCHIVGNCYHFENYDICIAFVCLFFMILVIVKRLSNYPSFMMPICLICIMLMSN